MVLLNLCSRLCILFAFTGNIQCHPLLAHSWPIPGPLAIPGLLSACFHTFVLPSVCLLLSIFECWFCSYHHSCWPSACSECHSPSSSRTTSAPHIQPLPEWTSLRLCHYFLRHCYFLVTDLQILKVISDSSYPLCSLKNHLSTKVKTQDHHLLLLSFPSCPWLCIWPPGHPSPLTSMATMSQQFCHLPPLTIPMHLIHWQQINSLKQVNYFMATHDPYLNSFTSFSWPPVSSVTCPACLSSHFSVFLPCTQYPVNFSPSLFIFSALLRYSWQIYHLTYWPLLFLLWVTALKCLAQWLSSTTLYCVAQVQCNCCSLSHTRFCTCISLLMTPAPEMPILNLPHSNPSKPSTPWTPGSLSLTEGRKLSFLEIPWPLSSFPYFGSAWLWWYNYLHGYLISPTQP